MRARYAHALLPGAQGTEVFSCLGYKSAKELYLSLSLSLFLSLYVCCLGYKSAKELYLCVCVCVCMCVYVCVCVLSWVQIC